MANTPNYNLPLFEADDAPDLLAVYNAAMNMLDTKLKEIDGASGAVFDPQPTDEGLTVSELAAAKKTASGIVYYKPAE
jgi:hypothetical protein